MSSGTDDGGAFVAAISGLLASNYCAVSTAALFIYECTITLEAEINLFWRRPFTGATALFTSNRVLVLVYLVYTLITTFVPMSERRLDYIAIVSYVLDVIQYFPWAAFSAMRAFALSRHWPLATLVFLLSVVPVAINLANFHFDVGGIVVPNIGCSSSDSVPIDIARRFTIASRACLVGADVILIWITWHRLSRSAVHHNTAKGSFAYVLLRDGTAYFLALCIFNALHLTLTLLSFQNPLTNVSIVTFFTEPLTAIIVSRFLIHLQSANVKATGMGSTQHSAGQSVSLVFERVVGSLGASIPTAVEVEEDWRDVHSEHVDFF